MKKLLSLKKFQKENQDALLEEEILAKVNGGQGGQTHSLTTEFQTTDEGWNCKDREWRSIWDGKPGPWQLISSEAAEFYGYHPYRC